MASLLVVTGASSEPSSISAKRGEAEAVLAQIRQIDSDLSRKIEEYNQATIELDRIDSELERARSHLGIARQANRVAQRNLEQRLVALYQNGDQTLLEVVFGSATLDDLLERVDAAERVSRHDSRIVDDVEAARADYRATLRQLERARSAQADVVAQRDAQRDEIESRLSERQGLYESIKGEIQSMEAEEARRQERLAAQAERRLAQQEEQAPQEVDEPSAASGEGAIAEAPPNPYGGVVGIALSYLGVPYVWGGSSPSGFDCSGFVAYVFGQIGVSLPHSTYALWGMGVPVSSSQLQPGDLVFFDGLGHMGIYIGGGDFVHAPHTGDVVKISSLGDSWYSASYVGARRIL